MEICSITRFDRILTYLDVWAALVFRIIKDKTLERANAANEEISAGREEKNDFTDEILA